MITTIPSKLVELGRIRIGHRAANKSGGGTHPEKLNCFRLTSRNKELLDYAARHPDIGGDVQEWAGSEATTGHKQYELYTNTDKLTVFVPTLMAVSISYERYSSAGCTLRCDGATVSWDVDKPRSVPYECECEDERNLACGAQRVLRLHVQLPDIPGLGIWLLQSRGYNATAELHTTFRQLAEMGLSHTIIEGTLCLEQRTEKKLVPPKKGNGKAEAVTYQYGVPVFWPKFTPRELMASATQQVALAAPVRHHLPSPSTEVFGSDNPDPVEAAVRPEWAALRTEILAVLTAQGLTPARKSEYLERHVDHATPGQLRGLLAKLQEAAAKKATTHMSAQVQADEDIPAPPAPILEEDDIPEPAMPVALSPDWREQLSKAIEALPEANLALRMQATAIAENPDATDDDGCTMLHHVILALETVPALEEPF